VFLKLFSRALLEIFDSDYKKECGILNLDWIGYENELKLDQKLTNTAESHAKNPRTNLCCKKFSATNPFNSYSGE
jgi:hypothetical protein|tara:strand:- start:247 stop:471 length:225 start_codon:yes stop_codon:yes gene_type:complete